MNNRPLLAALLCTLVAPSLLAQSAPKKGRWNNLKRDTPKGWVVHQTRHYQIQSQAGMEKARRLGAHMEKMLKVYKKLFKPGKRIDKRYAIKLLKNREAYRGYGGPPGAAAHYDRMGKEMVCYDTGTWQDEKELGGPVTPSGKKAKKEGEDLDTDKLDLEALRRKMRKRMSMDALGCAAHEGWHQYFAWYVTSWVQLPPWINEGMGDYLYAAVPRKAKRRQIPAELGRMFPGRLAIVKWAVRNNKHVPIKKLIRYSRSEYYANPGICYAQGWALCTFLRHSGNKRYEKVVSKFVALVKNDTNMKDVTDKAFKGIDLDKLEEEWKDWVLRIGFDGKLRDKKAEGAKQ
ncbi:MAG: hypothetical protein ACE5F1_11565 [Planctomycetota bacterium]